MAEDQANKQAQAQGAAKKPNEELDAVAQKDSPPISHSCPFFHAAAGGPRRGTFPLDDNAMGEQLDSMSVHEGCCQQERNDDEKANVDKSQVPNDQMGAMEFSQENDTIEIEFKFSYLHMTNLEFSDQIQESDLFSPFNSTIQQMASSLASLVFCSPTMKMPCEA
jgi:hypothetical protein